MLLFLKEKAIFLLKEKATNRQFFLTGKAFISRGKGIFSKGNMFLRKRKYVLKEKAIFSLAKGNLFFRKRQYVLNSPPPPLPSPCGGAPLIMGGLMRVPLPPPHPEYTFESHVLYYPFPSSLIMTLHQGRCDFSKL